MADQITYPHLPDDPCLTQEQLFAYIDDRLSPEQRHKAEHHLLDCPMCSDALDGLMQVKDRRKVAAFIPFAGEQIATEEKKDEAKVINIFAQPKTWFAMAASVVILTGVTIGIRLLMNGNGANEKTAQAVHMDSMAEDKIFDSIAAHTQPAPPNDNPALDSALKRSGGTPENLSSLDSFKGKGEIVDKQPSGGSYHYSWQPADQQQKAVNNVATGGTYSVNTTDANACCSGKTTTIVSANQNQGSTLNNLSNQGNNLPSFFRNNTNPSNVTSSSNAAGASSNDYSNMNTGSIVTVNKDENDNSKNSDAKSRGQHATNTGLAKASSDSVKSNLAVMESDYDAAGNDRDKKKNDRASQVNAGLQQSVSNSPNSSVSGPPPSANSNADDIVVPKTYADAQSSVATDTTTMMQTQQQHPLATKPTDSDLTFDYNKGVQLMGAGNYSAAIPFFDQVLTYPTNSHFEDAQWQKAQSLIKLGKKDDAKKLLQQIGAKKGKYAKQADDAAVGL